MFPACAIRRRSGTPGRSPPIDRRWSCGWTTCAKSCSKPNDVDRCASACTGEPTTRACATGQYSLKKPAGTFRVALVGDSIGAGWGVNAEDRFESILEEVWDEPRPAGRAGQKVEIINCAVPGHSPGQRWYHFGQIGWPMDPDLVIYQSTAADVGWDERRLQVPPAARAGLGLPHLPPAVLESAGVDASAAPTSTSGALHPTALGNSGRGLQEYDRRLPTHAAFPSSGCSFPGSAERATADHNQP